MITVKFLLAVVYFSLSIWALKAVAYYFYLFVAFLPFLFLSFLHCLKLLYTNKDVGFFVVHLSTLILKIQIALKVAIDKFFALTYHYEVNVDCTM